MDSVRSAALRMRKAGYSYNEITAKLGTPKSTLSSWLRDLVLSDLAQARLQGRVRSGILNGLVKRNKMQTHLALQRTRAVREAARKTIRQLGKEDLVLIGALLYWAEGYKRPVVRGGREVTSHSISFVNADPGMIRAFLHFLIEVLEVPEKEIVLAMRLYPHINERKAGDYWLGITRLQRSNLRKTTYLISGASKLRRPFNRLPYGTLQIAVYDTEKFYRLMGLIDGVKKQFDYGIVPKLPG